MNIDSNLMLMDNPFVSNLFDLYDKAYFSSESDWKMEKVEEFCFCGITKKKEMVNVGAREAYEKAKKFSDGLSVQSLDLTTINQFCDFIRVIEKCLFYINDTDSRLFVDSGLEDTTKVLIYKSDEMQFKIETKSIKDPTQHNTYREVLQIDVKRLYGKQMVNTFTVVDRDVKYNDDSDLYLINTLNLVLLSNMKSIYQSALERVYKLKVESGTWR